MEKVALYYYKNLAIIRNKNLASLATNLFPGSKVYNLRWWTEQILQSSRDIAGGGRSDDEWLILRACCIATTVTRSTHQGLSPHLTFLRYCKTTVNIERGVGRPCGFPPAPLAHYCGVKKPYQNFPSIAPKWYFIN